MRASSNDAATAIEDIALARPNPLAVVIVTYNSAKVLPGLLSSVKAGLAGIPRYEVIVADNASRDGTVDIAASHPIGVRIVQTGRNAGYAAAINAAVATVSADTDVLVLNPDIRLSSGVVRIMRDRLSDASVGAVVPRITGENGRVSLSLRREPSILTVWAEAVIGGTLARQLNLGEVIARPDTYNRRGTVEWATGAILLVSASARRRVGDWDESFFLYSEEVDFMRRVRAAGLTVEYVPEANVVHIGGDTRASPLLFSLSVANRVRDYSRRHGRFAAALFRLGVITGEVMRYWRGPEHRAALYAVLNARR
jgi:GT2 family glycosyltransferase